MKFNTITDIVDESPGYLETLQLDCHAIHRVNELINVFILGRPHKLKMLPSEEEVCELWEYYEKWRSDPKFNEMILQSFVENQVWLQGSIFNLAQHYKRNGDFEQALKYLDKMVQFEGESDDEMYARAQILFLQRKYSACGRCLKKLIRRYPQFDGPKLLNLRLAFVTCRPRLLLKQTLAQVYSSKIKFSGDSKGKYKVLALAHLITPEEFNSNTRMTPYVDELITLRRQFSLERRRRQATTAQKDHAEEKLQPTASYC